MERVCLASISLSEERDQQTSHCPCPELHRQSRGRSQVWKGLCRVLRPTWPCQGSHTLALRALKLGLEQLPSSCSPERLPTVKDSNLGWVRNKQISLKMILCLSAPKLALSTDPASLNRPRSWNVVCRDYRALQAGLAMHGVPHKEVLRSRLGSLP